MGDFLDGGRGYFIAGVVTCLVVAAVFGPMFLNIDTRAGHS
jgi:hypothetical protein